MGESLKVVLLALLVGTLTAATAQAQSSTPDPVTASAVSANQINLTWTGISNAQGYSIVRSLNAATGFTEIYNTADKSVTSYSDRNLTAFTTYYYKVRSVRPGGFGPDSAVVSARTLSSPPTVSITSPATGTSYTSAQTVTIAASAADDVGVVRVEFYDGATLRGTDSTAPYTFPWPVSSAVNGTHLWTARAYDVEGLNRISGGVSLTVNVSLGDLTPPSVPTGFSAVATTCHQVFISWNASVDTGGSGLAGYKVFRNGSQIGTAVSTAFSSTGLAASTTYSFTVAAYDNAGNTSAQTAAASATTPACLDTTAPSIPANVTATVATCTQINVAWSASTDTGGSGLAGYKIFRNGTQIGTSVTTTYASTGLTPSTPYSFTVAAYDNAGNTSAQSAIRSATTSACTSAPAGPTGLTAVAISTGQINLTWTDNSSNETGFKVERSTASTGPWIQIALTAANVASYPNTGLTASTTYYYRVRAYNAAGDSAYTNNANATTLSAGNQLPVANAGSDQVVTVGTQVSLNGSASRDPDGSIVSYAWSFGDGTTGSGVSVTHTYNVAGTYWVTLTVTDSVGGRGTDQAYIDVRPAAGAGQFDWVQRYGGTGGDLGYKVAVDVNGYMNLAGSFQSAASFGGSQLTSAGSDDVFVARYSATGTHQWSKRFGGSGTDAASDVAVDSNGDVVVCGYFSGTADFGGGQRTSAGAYDIFVAKYSANGTHLWSKTFGATADDTANSVAVDAGGNVIVTGVFRWTVNFGLGGLTSALYGAPDMFIAKYAADGTPLWTRNFSGPSSDYGSSVAVDSADNILLTGGFLGSLNLGGLLLSATGTTSEDFYVAKFTPAGQHVWSKRFGNIGTDTASDIAVDGSNNVLVTGQFALTVDFGGGGRAAVGQDVYVLKLSGTGGSHIWSKNFTSTGNEIGNSIAADGAGNILVTGYLDGSVNFGGGTMTTAGSADIFVLKLGASNGAHVWSRRYGATSFEQGLGITVDGNDKPLVTGYFKGTVDFGGGPISGSGTAADIFLLELWP